MTEKERLNRLEQQLNQLLQQQLQSIDEIRRLQTELKTIQNGKKSTHDFVQSTVFQEPIQPAGASKEEVEPTLEKTPVSEQEAPFSRPETDSNKRDWEQYIGGHLINKIGIIILLIGLGLFVKYAIDKGYFPPVVRVALGYLSGLVLTYLAWRMKEKYLTYSAVLFGGGMAVLYFTTYLGCTFFQPAIVPLLPAFNLMAVFMVVTLLVAGRYNSQVIGLLGLVGAYAVPFLVDTGSKNFLIFFAYITIINAGVLILAAKKVWSTMTWSACILTWIIAFTALLIDWSALESSPVMWAFALVSFQIFYAAILAPQLWNPQKIEAGTYIFAGINALFFYVMTLSLSQVFFTQGGLTLLHCIPHFAVAYLLWKKLDRPFPTTFFTIMGLVFLTGAIPLEFNTHTIIWLWIAETVLLFFLARKFNRVAIEYFAFGVGILSVLMLMGSWEKSYFGPDSTFPVLVNWYFADQVWVLAGTVALYFLNKKIPKDGAGEIAATLRIAPFVLLYFLFFNELHHWFDLMIEPGTPLGNYLDAARLLWLINYSAAFVAVLGVLNLSRWKNKDVGAFVSVAAVLLLFTFLSLGLMQLNFLRDEYILKKTDTGFWMIGSRYLSYVIQASLLLVTLKMVRQFAQLRAHEKYLPLSVHILLLYVLSQELATAMFLAMDTVNTPIPYREGFSTLWGVYSLLLIGLGIRNKSQVLRVAGMGLFGITLFKVFFADMANLPIISRTLIFIGLGVLLLIASYLYQKFRDRL